MSYPTNTNPCSVTDQQIHAALSAVAAGRLSIPRAFNRMKDATGTVSRKGLAMLDQVAAAEVEYEERMGR